MRIFLHDFAGYPLSAQLGRALAERGHTVLFVYCGSLTTTPSGTHVHREGDPEGLQFRAVHLSRPLDKFSFIRRWRQENEYGRLVAQEVGRFRPDVVLSADTPLDAQRALLRTCRREGIRFVFWLQDLIGVAADRILRKKLPGLGALIGAYYLRMERDLLRRSDAVVSISEDFGRILEDWQVAPEKTMVIENWPPLENLPVRPRDNLWAREHGLHDKTCLLYSGTLAMKHNPALLLSLARRFREQPDVRVVVVSTGPGADWLRAQARADALENLIVLGFQPYERVPDVMGAADVLVAVLEPDAAAFSVPSKVLAYLCAARPLLLAVPASNLAARIVTESEAGYVVEPTDEAALLDRAAALIDTPALRDRMGRNARAYAERTYDIEVIADRFMAVLSPLPQPEQPVLLA